MDYLGRPERYSDEEAALILRRAAELQHVEGQPPSTTGFTLAELQQIAREAGIDPQRVADAAALVHGGRNGRWTRILGAPARFRYETSIEGELPDHAWGVLLEEIRAVMRKPGQVSHLPGALEWRQDRKENTGAVEIVVTSQAGTTHIGLNADNRSLAGILLAIGAWVGLAGTVTMGEMIVGFGISEWVAGAGGAGGGIAAAWAGWRHFAGRWEKQMSSLAARITRTATDAARTTHENTTEGGADN